MGERSTLSYKHHYTFVAATLGLLVLTGFIGIWAYLKTEGSVAGILTDNDQTVIKADIYGCDMDLTVYPERRIPAANNWATDLVVYIYDSGNTLLGTLTGTSDNAGLLTEDLCSQGIYLTSGTYNIKVRGKSHLTKGFNSINGFTYYTNSIDLTGGGERLLAGETSLVYDNYINGLDLSTQIKALYSGNDKDDLNQDGIVNSLDISNTLSNLLTTGD